MRRALAGIALTAAAAIGLAGCIGTSNDDITPSVPKMFQTLRKPPLLNIMHMEARVKVDHRPRAFHLNVILWWYVGNRFSHRVHVVRIWKRGIKDLPAAGKAKNLHFPNLQVNVPADDFLPCEPGLYFAQFHTQGDSHTGKHYDLIEYYPYNSRYPKGEKPPPRRQAWNVTCTKTEQVPNPKGETTTPALTFGAAGWTLTVR